MGLKSILAAYAGDADGSSGLKLAIHMARKYDAHLTGVVWYGPSPFEHRFRRYMTAEVLDTLASRDDEVVAEMRADFEARITAENLQGRSNFIELRSNSDFSLAACSRGYDITVIGHRASAIGKDHFAARPDVVALRSGKPVILVPSQFEPEQLGRRALVAWDGKRAAARALGDALHILATKDSVTVLSVGSAPSAGPGDDVMTLLKRHGIAADHVIRPAAKGSIGRTILDTCSEVDAGLLIMGAYEHSKFAEDLLGGVTRDILDMSHIPVLLSH
jgi:nucleotide-binding universal stress UspA family protein